MSDEREFKIDIPKQSAAKKRPMMVHQAKEKQAEKKKEIKLSDNKLEKKARRDYVEREEEEYSMKDRLAGGLAAKIQLILFLFVIAVFSYMLLPIVQEILAQ